MRISKNDVNVLRKLGEQYMELALLPVHKEKLSMWKALNRCEPERPMAVIDQLPWHELEELDASALSCVIKDPYWLAVERELRQKIYKWNNFPVDMVLEPYITIPAEAYQSGYGITADADTIIKSENETARARHYNAVIKELEDVARIKDMEIISSPAQNLLNLQEAGRIFDGAAPFKLSHGLQFHLGAWDFLSTCMGVEDIYYNLVDCPELLHAAMRRVTDATLAGIKSANELMVHNDISGTCHCSYVYTDELLPDFGRGKGALSKNSWAFGMAQVFTSVSADVTFEFELPYIKEMAEQFGMSYYGCCELLDDRLDIISKIPNVKKISCSPWSDREKFTAKLDKKLIMSNKPSPAFLAESSFSGDAVRDDIIRTCEAAKENGVSLELILKDISTVRKDAARLKKWNDIVMDAVLPYA
jgi:hypothetical protein